MGSTEGRSNPGNYALDRSLHESMRLSLQHFYWRKHVGWLLHPSIPREKADLKVADIGTGTGVWMFDAADELPSSAQFVGYDVSLEQAPNSGFFPKNVKMQILDALAPIPDELEGQFDVVNLRFFVCVIKNTDPTPVVQNLKKLLKPGGWLQWAEIHSPLMKPFHVSGAVDDSALEAMLDCTIRKMSHVSTGDWMSNLHKYFEAEGLINVQCHTVPADENSPAWAALTQVTTLAAFSGVLRNLPPGEARATAEKALVEAEKAMHAGTIWTQHWVTYIGQKPL